ncbi:hypothetical protein [Streptomyces sp. NBC_00344]
MTGEPESAESEPAEPEATERDDEEDARRAELLAKVREANKQSLARPR